MARTKSNYYEILGLKPDAKHTDVGIAFNRKLAALRREDAPPDPRGEDTLRQAFAVLGDLDQRAQYDRSLVAERLKPAFTARQGITAVVIVGIVVSGITWYLLKRNADNVAQAQGLSPEMIAAQTTPAVGRLTSTDMGGQSKPIGLAFAIDAGVMVASCEGIGPNAQLTVNMNPRVVPARLTMTDEGRGLCKLEVEGAGSWPIPVAAADARAGDIVYVTSVNAVGEVVLKEARVKSVVRNGPVATIDATVGPITSGAPLLDRQGRVVGVVTSAAGGTRHMVLPKAWTEAPKPAAPAASSPEAPVPAQGGDEGMAISRTGKPLPVTQEQADRLNKAFRPPPNVPKELD